MKKLTVASEKKTTKTNRNHQRRRTIHGCPIQDTFSTPLHTTKTTRKKLQVVSVSKTSSTHSLLFPASEAQTPYTSTSTSDTKLIDSLVKPKSKLSFVSTKASSRDTVAGFNDVEGKHGQSKGTPGSNSVDSHGNVKSKVSAQTSSVHFVPLRKNRNKLDFVVKESKKEVSSKAKSKCTLSESDLFENTESRNHSEILDKSHTTCSDLQNTSILDTTRQDVKSKQLYQDCKDMDINVKKSKQKTLSCASYEAISDDEHSNSVFSDKKSSLLSPEARIDSPKTSTEDSCSSSSKSRLKTFRKTNSGTMRKSLQESRISALKNHVKKEQPENSSPRETETIIIPSTPEQDNHSQFELKQQKDWMRLFEEPFPRRSPRLCTLPVEDPKHHAQLLDNLSPLTSRENTRQRKSKSASTPRNTSIKKTVQRSAVKTSDDNICDGKAAVKDTDAHTPLSTVSIPTNLEDKRGKSQLKSKSVLKMASKDDKSSQQFVKKTKQGEQEERVKEKSVSSISAKEMHCSVSKGPKKDDFSQECTTAKRDKQEKIFVDKNGKDCDSLREEETHCKTVSKRSRKKSHVSRECNNTTTRNNNDDIVDCENVRQSSSLNEEEIHFPKPSKELCKPGGPFKAIKDFCLPDKDFVKLKLAKIKGTHARKVNTTSQSNYTVAPGKTMPQGKTVEENSKATDSLKNMKNYDTEKSKKPVTATATAKSKYTEERVRKCSPNATECSTGKSMEKLAGAITECVNNDNINEYYSETCHLSEPQDKSLVNGHSSDTAMQNPDSGSGLSESILDPQVTTINNSSMQNYSFECNSEDKTPSLPNSDSRDSQDCFSGSVLQPLYDGTAKNSPTANTLDTNLPCSSKELSKKDSIDSSNSQSLSQSIFQPLAENNSQSESHRCESPDKPKSNCLSAELITKQSNSVIDGKDCNKMCFPKGGRERNKLIPKEGSQGTYCIPKEGSQSTKYVPEGGTCSSHGKECIPSSQGSVTPSPNQTILAGLLNKPNQNTGLTSLALVNNLDNVPENMQHEDNNNTTSIVDAVNTSEKQDGAVSTNEGSEYKVTDVKCERDIPEKQDGAVSINKGNEYKVTDVGERDIPEKQDGAVSTNKGNIPEKQDGAISTNVRGSEYKANDVECEREIPNDLDEQTDEPTFDSQYYGGSFPLCSNTEEFDVEYSTQPDIPTTVEKSYTGGYLPGLSGCLPGQAKDNDRNLPTEKPVSNADGIHPGQPVTSVDVCLPGCLPDSEITTGELDNAKVPFNASSMKQKTLIPDEALPSTSEPSCSDNFNTTSKGGEGLEYESNSFLENEHDMDTHSNDPGRCEDTVFPTTPPHGTSLEACYSEESQATEPSIGDRATPSGKAELPQGASASVSPCGVLDDRTMTPILMQACLEHPNSDSSQVQSISMSTYSLPGNIKREVIAVCLSQWIVLWMKGPGREWTVLHTWTVDLPEIYQKVQFLPSSSHLVLFAGGSLASSIARIYTWSDNNFQDFKLEYKHLSSEVSFNSMCVLSNQETDDMVIFTVGMAEDEPIVSKWNLDPSQCKEHSSLPVPDQSSVLCLSTVEGSSCLLLGVTRDTLILWNYQTCIVLKVIPLPRPGLHGVDHLHATTQMGLLFLILVCETSMLKATGRGSFIIALNPKNNRLKCLSKFSNSPTDSSVTCGGGCDQYIALGQANGEVCLWNTLSPDTPVNVPVFQGSVDCITFHPTRPIVAFGGGHKPCVHLYSLS